MYKMGVHFICNYSTQRLGGRIIDPAARTSPSAYCLPLVLSLSNWART